MDNHYLIRYLIVTFKSILRFALYGAGIAAGVGLLILLIVALSAGDTVVDGARVVGALKNYVIVGASFGGIIGLLYGLLAFRE